LRHESEVLSATFSPDGTQVVAGSRDGRTRLWDAATGDERGPLHSHDTGVIAVAYSADGARLVTSSDGYSLVWDVASGKTVGPPIGHRGAIHPPALASDDAVMVTTSTADEVGIWDIGRPVPAVRWNLRREDGVVAAAFSRDGRLVTASEDGTVRLWNARTRQEVGLPLIHGTAVRWAVFSPDDTRLMTLAADGTARIWEVPTGAPQDQPLLATLAEGLGGHAVDQTGGVVRLTDAATRRADLKSRAAEASARSGSAAALAQWLFSDPRTRTIAPLSAVTPRP
jgi:WD40 repeat protein